MITEESKRVLERLKYGRITYDCQNCHQVTDGRQRVRCALGKKLNHSRDGTVDLYLIEKGWTPAICLTCKEFLDGRD